MNSGSNKHRWTHARGALRGTRLTARTISVDCTHVHTAAEFWQLYLDVVNPEGADLFGRNLDAFDDALDGGPGFPGMVDVLFVNTRDLDRQFLAALKQIASEHATPRILFD